MAEKDEKKRSAANEYMRYSGLGFQIAGTIGLGVFIGYKLDKWLKTPGPYFTVACSFIFLIAGFYIGFKDFFKKK